MNAHQRRIHRRSRVVFDIEAFPMIDWDKLHNMALNLKAIRPSGPRLSTLTGRSEGIIVSPYNYPYSRAVNILKARPLCDNSQFVFSPDGLDFSAVEERILALCAK